MLINVANLRLTKTNPRLTKTSAAADAELLASLKAYGQLTSLLVKPSPEGDGIFDIIEGGRRYKIAPKAGITELKADLYEGSHAAEEVGTAANMAREAMHPLDQAAVIARRLADGETAAEVAARFGHTARWAEQRLKLDGLADRIKKAFRADTVSLATAEAFTLGSRTQQDDYLKKARHDWQLRPDEIRRHFTNAAISAKHALFDLAHYPKASIVTDLFGADVWLTDRAEFERLQTAAAETKAEQLRAEGWSEVAIVVNHDPQFWQKYLKVEGKILKADRAKHLAFVIYDPRDGEVTIDRGYTTRDAVKAKKGKRPADDKAAEKVKPLTCFDLNQSQQQIIGALQTEGIAKAIAAGDTWLALKTLLSPLLSDDPEQSPPWSGLRPSRPQFIGANVIFDQKLEHPELASKRFPSRATFATTSWDDVMAFVRSAALASMQLLYGPSHEAAKETKAAGVDWFRYDAGMLRRYRLDALQDLAKHLKVASAGLKKHQLVDAVLAHQGTPFLPIKWEG